MNTNSYSRLETNFFLTKKGFLQENNNFLYQIRFEMEKQTCFLQKNMFLQHTMCIIIIFEENILKTKNSCFKKKKMLSEIQRLFFWSKYTLSILSKRFGEKNCFFQKNCPMCIMLFVPKSLWISEGTFFSKKT